MGKVQRCIVAGCIRSAAIHDLCTDCHEMLATATITTGTTFIHQLRDDHAEWREIARRLLREQNERPNDSQ